MIDLGQIFTKGTVAHYMVSLFDLSRYASIMDPCFGDGAFLDALVSYGYTNITACEIDTNLFSATKDKYPQYRLLNVDFLGYDENKRYDGIIMNPPYIRQEKIDELEVYGITKEKLRCVPFFSSLPSTANMYMYFIMKAIDLLKENGQLIVIFPSTWMNAKTGEGFQRLMFEKCGLERQIHICGDVFEREALVEVIILKLIKGRIDLNANEEFLESRDGTLTSISVSKKKIFNIFSYPFSKLATIKRGVTTGCNKMYINPDISCDDKYFRPIISSPKNIYGYTTVDAHLDKLLFPLEKIESNEIIEYLNFWKKKILKEKKPKTLYLKINNNEKWYELREICGNGILFSYFVRNDMKFVMNEIGALVRDNFYIIKPKVDKWILFALLNNYYTYYQLELNGKRYGAGLLKLQRYDIEELKFPVYELISETDKKKMKELSHKLLDTGDSTFVAKITKVISNYCSVNYNEISEKYFSIKAERLEVN